MSNTIAQRPHVHHRVPLVPVLAVIIAIALAAAVLWAINQPEPATITTTDATSSIVSIAPAAVPVPATAKFRHELADFWANDAYRVARAQQVKGTTLDPVSTSPYGSTAYEQSD